MVKLRPSEVLAFENCPKSHALRKEGWRPAATSANLVFGTVVHQTIEKFLKRELLPEGMADYFQSEFDKARASEPIQFSSRMPAEKMLDMGRKLVGAFADAWQEFGLTPATDEDGNLFMERRLEADIGDGVILSCQPDLLAWNREAELVVVDFKTASSEATPEFLALSDQLTAYQIVLDAWAEEAGLPAVSQVGFVEGLKRATPRWSLKMGPRRTDEQAEDYLNKVRFTADQIRKGRVFRRSLMAWNSPCRMCDFAKLCAEGHDENLVFKADESRLVANSEWF